MNNKSEIPPFHLAFPVSDLEKTKTFYEGLLGCRIGRTSGKWIDFDFFGHQVTAHLRPDELQKTSENKVDGHNVPVRHFGVILEWDNWQRMAEKLQNKEIDFIIDPYIRFKGEPGEQATMFFLDPSGNALEFKAFKNKSQIFAT